MSLIAEQTPKSPAESAAAESGAEGAAAAAAGAAEGAAGEGGSDRPAWLPEKFKTPEDLAKSYGELETWRGKKEEEIAASLLKDRPEAAEKYELPKLEDPNVDTEALAASPITAWWRETAFKRGLSQSEFEAGIGKYLEAAKANLPDPEAEIAALGENANQRIEAVTLWAQKSFQGEEFQAVRQLGTTAAGIKLLERFMKVELPPTQDVSGEGASSASGGQDDEATIRKLMDSKEYYSPAHRDPKVVARVDAFYQKRYGA